MDHRVPVPAASVATHCGEEVVSVQVKQNFFGNGRRLFVCLFVCIDRAFCLHGNIKRAGVGLEARTGKKNKNGADR